MNILLISQCSKNALAETRRILDQFAERRGERVWQTAITQQGLATLHRLLRQTARRNTAVDCHWIRGKDHSELLWIVGDGRQFNERGATPTNTTGRDVLRAGDENDWHSAEDIRLLARLAALFHDVGKANKAFQKKLKSAKPIADAYRHEWVSLRLFEAFVRSCGDSDQAWLTRLCNPSEPFGKVCLDKLQKDGMTSQALPSPFKGLPPLAQIVGWLVVSHHRLPTPPMKKDDVQRSSALQKLPEGVEHGWCGSRPDEASAKACWDFSGDLPMDSRHWRQHTAKVAQAILQRHRLSDENQAAALLNNPYVLHLSRMALMLADHYYSAQSSHARYGDQPGKSGKTLYANTDRDGNLKQRLDEHLIGVEVNASRIVRSLPRLADALPRIARHKKFRERSSGLFRWQNLAYDCAASLQARSERHGFFGVNMASTGCGKTLGNGRIMYALANPQRGARFTVALGLRTLTLQTGDAYRDRLHLGPADLAVLVGGVATRALHEQQRQQAEAESKAAQQGTESSADLLPEHNYVHYDGNLEDGPLKDWLGKTDARRLLDAPVLACTIDHLMPATEGARGGHQIAPMLRLMKADLVLDEPDDFGIEDLPALTRLVHWAGLLGSRVLLSSATLPPALVQGLFQAYLQGRKEYQHHRGVPGEWRAVCCAWFDEFNAEASDHADGADYLAAHRRFVERRLAKLAAASHGEVRRRAAIQPLPIRPRQPRADLCREFAAHLRPLLHTLHRQHHSIDPHGGQRVSFGLVRMANIDPLFDVALSLAALGAEAGCHIHLCVYHSRHPLLVRAAIERELDGVLKRQQADAVFDRPGLRQSLAASSEPDHLFIVLATAVAEVGRDHDYDWAIVEPSSMRSIIQLAGRVQRHRRFNCPENQPNIYLLDTNLRHLENGDNSPAFLRPGFESASFGLHSHRLAELLVPAQWQIISAAPRIQAREPLTRQTNLADLEHARLADLMLGADPAGQKAPPVKRWWETRAALSGYLQRKDPFRDDPLGRQPYALIPDEDGKLDFYRLEDNGKQAVQEGLSASSGKARALDDPFTGPRITPWAVPRYLDALEQLAESQHIEVIDCAKKYAVIDLPYHDGGQLWRYHWALGFSRVR
ncbi:MAG: type I-F CRISPR-associated helicase Cas3f [Candidatus Methylumidiphilus sp.]